jgi:hypothetical protein
VPAACYLFETTAGVTIVLRILGIIVLIVIIVALLLVFGVLKAIF